VTKQLIMIVEDEIIIARELEMRLLDMGYDVSGLVATGPKAIKCVAENPPNLILMDINLKGEMDGIETAAQIQSHHSIPIIYLTAFTDEKTLERAKLTEPYGYIVKPFAERELHANIEMALYKHNAETKLRKVSRWFAGSINEVGDAVIVTDERGLIDYMNKHAEAITEWSVTEAQGKPLADVLRLRDSKTNCPIALNDTLATQDIVLNLGDETILETRTGALVNVDCTTTIIENENDKEQGRGTVSVLRDVSGQMRGVLANVNADVAAALGSAISIPEMLQVCAESINYNLKTAGVQIWSVNTPDNTLALQASVGISTYLVGKCSTLPIAQSIIDLIAQQRVPHLTNDAFNDSHVNASGWARRENITSFAGYPLLVDDRLVGVMTSFSRNKLHENVLSSLGSIANSIAVGIERKQAEGQLRTSESELRGILNSLQDVYYHADNEGRVVRISPSVLQVFGYQPEELIGKPITIGWRHPEIREEMLEAMQAGGGAVQNFEAEGVCKDGSIIWISVNSQFFYDEQGNVTGVEGTLRDVTQRKQAEKQARNHQNELAHMERLNTMGEMATGIAHELNQPLAAISNYAAASQNIVASGIKQPEILSEALDAIGTQARRAGDIIRSLRQFVEKQAPQNTAVGLNYLVEVVLSFFQSDIKNQSVYLEKELAEGLPEAYGNAIQIEQVLVNLVRNSLEAMELSESENRQLTIRTYLNEEGMIQAEITDTGPGMDNETLRQIFEPFVTTKGVKGMGMGLSISLSIIETNGGRLWAKSEPGKGASFFLTVPLTTE